MIVVSYYTPPYEPEVEKLRESLNKYGLDCYLEPIASKGSWRLNCGYKPTFLLSMLDKYKQPVVWLDADCIVDSPPEKLTMLKEGHCDFGAFFIPHRVMRKADIPGGPESGADGISSGTMIFMPTPASLGLLLLWQEMDRHDTGLYEQRVLGEAWLRTEKYGGLRTVRLPQSYYKVFDCRWFDSEDVPVISHYQASRKYRKKA